MAIFKKTKDSLKPWNPDTNPNLIQAGVYTSPGSFILEANFSGSVDDVVNVIKGTIIYFNLTENKWEVAAGSNVGGGYWDRSGIDLMPTNAGDNVNLQSGGLKDEHVTVAIKLGDVDNTSFSTTNKTIVGAVNELNENKEDASNKVSAWQVAPDNLHYPSEKLTKDTLDQKENSSNKVASFSVTPNNTNYPTEKLVYDQLATKMAIQGSATNNNLAKFSSGQTVDSGLSVQDLQDLEESYINLPAYQDFTNVTGTSLILTTNSNCFLSDGTPAPQSITNNALIVSNSVTATLTSDPAQYPRTSAFSSIKLISSIITASNTNQAVTLSGTPRTADKDNIRIYFIIRCQRKDVPAVYNDFPKNVRVNLQAMDTEGMATDDELIAGLATKIDIASGSFNAFTNKATPVDADIISGENSENSFSKIKITTLNLFTYIKNRFGFVKIYYVSPSGISSNNGFSAETAMDFATALSTVGNSGNQICVLPGTYSGNFTLSALNVTISAINNETGGLCNFTGSLTVSNNSSSNRINGLTFSAINHTGSGNLYLENVRINTALNASGNGYLELKSCDTQGSSLTGVINITGSGNKNFFDRSSIGFLTVNNASAIVNVADSVAVAPCTLTAGTLLLQNQYVYSATSTTNAITATGGTLAVANVTTNIPSNLARARISISAGVFYSFSNFNYDQANSTISGTNLGSNFVFDAITLIGNLRLNALTASQLVATDANKNLQSLSTSTYPSLTELSYSKGVTSAIQTQLNSKEPTITAGTTSQYWRGDKTWQDLATTIVVEGTNLYFTAARAIASLLTGYTKGAGTVSASDTILEAIQKLDGNADLKASLASPAFTGDPTAPTQTQGDNSTKLATTEYVDTLGATKQNTITQEDIYNENKLILQGGSNVTLTTDDTGKTITISSSGGGGGGSSTLSGLSDVSLGTLANNNVLMYSTVVSKWVNNTIATLKSALGLSKSDVGLSNVTDDAQLKRSANDFTSFTQKTSPTGNDVLLIEDASASGVKKYITNSSLPISTATQAALDAKANLVSTPTNNNILTTNGSGQPQDSGKSFNDSGTTANEILSALATDNRITQAQLSQALAYVSCVSTSSFSATYNNGSSGVGATLTATSTGALIFDDYAPSLGEDVALYNLANPNHQGIYTVTTLGTPSVAGVLTRRSDFNEPAEMKAGRLFVALYGTANKGIWATASNVSTVGSNPVLASIQSISLSGVALVANNLSEYTASASTARSNISAAKSGINTDITSISLDQDGLNIKSNSASSLQIRSNDNLTANRTFNIITGDADRTLNLSNINQANGLVQLNSSGDFVQTTDNLSEGSTNKWWTNARTLASTLISFAPQTFSTIISSDTVLTALQKIQGFISALSFSNISGTLALNQVPTGRINVSACNRSAQTIPPTTSTILTNWIEDYDTENTFDPVQGIFRAPRALNCLISASVRFATKTISNGDRHQIFVSRSLSYSCTITRSSNTVTVTTPTAHGYAIGNIVKVFDVASPNTTFNNQWTITAVPSATTFRFTFAGANITTPFSGRVAKMVLNEPLTNVINGGYSGNPSAILCPTFYTLAVDEVVFICAWHDTASDWDLSDPVSKGTTFNLVELL